MSVFSNHDLENTFGGTFIGVTGENASNRSMERRFPELCGGERELMTALLCDGIEAYMSSVSGQGSMCARERSDAMHWVNTRNYSYVFSFDVVCESLGLDPEYVRQGIYSYASNSENLEPAILNGKPITVSLRDRTYSSPEQEPEAGKSKKWRRVRRPRKK